MALRRRRSTQRRQAWASLPPAGDVARSGEAGARPWAEVFDLQWQRLFFSFFFGKDCVQLCLKALR